MNKSKLKIVYSTPGLPYQRSVGWETLKSLKHSKYFTCVSFLDDDCHIQSEYFLNLDSWIKNNPNYIGVTGIPNKVIKSRANLIKRLFLLQTETSGKVLQSGFANVPVKSGSTQWLPGLCMNVNPIYLELEKFNPKIRIYCEDLEFSLRLIKYGPLSVNEKMVYTHHVSPINRENTFTITKYTLGMNYWMARNNYYPIRKWAVIWSSIGVIIMDILVSTCQMRKYDRTKGALSFWFNLISKKQIIQEV